MLKIRLQRTGRKNSASFRMLVTESQNGPKSGKFLEILGSYNPAHDKPELKAERILHWIKNGAQPSPTVHNLLINAGIIEGKKVNVLPKKSPIVKEMTEEEKKAEEEANKPKEETPAENEAPKEEVKEEEVKEEEAPVEEKPTEEKPPETEKIEEAAEEKK